MGLLDPRVVDLPLAILGPTYAISIAILVVLLNVLKQLLFKLKDEPPVVFHWFPFIGSAISYGQEPTKFLQQCQAKVCALCQTQHDNND